MYQTRMIVCTEYQERSTWTSTRSVEDISRSIVILPASMATMELVRNKFSPCVT